MFGISRFRSKTLNRSSFPLHSKEWSVDGERFTGSNLMKSKRIKRILTVVFFVSLALLIGYLESHYGITPNH